MTRVLIPAYDAGATDDRGAGMVILTKHLRLRKVLNEMHQLGFSESVSLFKDSETDKEDDTDSAAKPDPVKLKNGFCKTQIG